MSTGILNYRVSSGRDPETRAAIIWCAWCGAQKHTYVGATRATTPDSPPSPDYKLMYRCGNCGEDRQWGSSREPVADEYKPEPEAA